ncbi:MAG TPA: Ig-like domain-containing protein [Steroidobacteraceae bacterium]|nr:Ig-like domain-containing protein [Steroidobacteraceae bacterium]
MKNLVAILCACATLTACGGGGGPKNASPTASAAAISTNEDAPGTGTITASDPDGDSLSASIGAAPAKGTAAITGSGPFTVTYTPAANQNGADSFTVVVNDGHGGSATATVPVTITPQPDDPVLNAQTFTLAEDATFNGTVAASDPDGDALAYTVTAQPAHGTLTPGAAGAFTYAPASNYHGADTFGVEVSDGQRTRAAAMSLVVTSVNDPVEVRGEYSALGGTTASIDVLANDSDVDGDPLTVTIESQPPGGTAVIESNRVRVTAAAGMAGPTSLTYRVSDGAGSSAVGTLGLVFGTVRPFFYTTGAARTNQRHIRFSNYFVNTELETPIPTGETFERFATSASGAWLVYVTRSEGPPVRHRLWLRAVGAPSIPVTEIVTGDPSFFVRSLSLSPDGTLVAFNGRIAAVATPGTSQLIDNAGIDIEKPVFTNDSRHVYYVVLMNGGGRVIKRADVSATGVVGNRVQITADYQPAEGLGIDYVLTPDEQSVVSLGLILPPPGSPIGSSIQQHAFVTLADGNRNDLRLHPQPLPPIEGAGSLPDVSPDSRYAAFMATLNGGVNGLYAADLQSPGSPLRVVQDGGSLHQIAGDSRTVFYAVSSAPSSVNTWYRARLDTAAAGVAFAPAAGASAPRLLLAARDSSAVVFDGGSTVFATLGNQFTVATPLLALPGGETAAQLKYANDWNSLLVFRASGSAVTLVNPRAPGWSAPLLPLPDFTDGVSAACVAFAGEGCS